MLVAGTRVPVVGNVTMDMTMIDVTDVPCAIGDVATLIGADGDDRIDVERGRRDGRAESVRGAHGSSRPACLAAISERPE